MDRDHPCDFDPLELILLVLVVFVPLAILNLFDLKFDLNINNTCPCCVRNPPWYCDPLVSFVLMITIIVALAILALAIAVLQLWKKVEENG